MNSDHSILPDENKSREQLIRELAEMRSRLSDQSIHSSNENAQTPSGVQWLRSGFNHKETAEALKATEHRTSILLEKVTDGFVALDRESRIAYVNQAGVLMSGMRREDLIGHCIWDLFPHAESSGFYSQYKKALETNAPVHFEGFYPDPLNIWVECHAYPFPEGMSVFIRNITERREMEETLRKERAVLEAVVEKLDVGVIIADSEGTVLSMNPAALKMHGFETASEMFNQHEQYINGFEMLSVDGKLLLPEDRPALRSLRGEYFSNVEMLVRDRRTGRQWAGRWSVSPVRNNHNEVIFLVFTVQDITEHRDSAEALRQSEKKFRSLFDYSPDAVFLTIPDGSIKAANLSACKMFGHTQEEICSIGRSGILDVHDPRLHDALKERQSRGFISGCELTAIRKNGEKFPVEVDSVILPGEPAQSFVIIRDITARKQAEESMRRLNETLEQRVDERTRLAEARSSQLQSLAVELIEAEEGERRLFAQLLHDDLQQMLAAAKMQLQAISGNFPHEMILKNVDHILEESIAKTRRLSHELSPAVLHHSGLAAGLQWLAGHMEKQFGLKVDLVANAVPPFEDTALKVFLFRSVQELLFNAVKHAGIKEAQVCIANTEKELVITVSDHGKGFDPDYLQEPDAKAGFGLLSIRERANYIGGSLAINSAPGKGSRFTLKVPFGYADAADYATTANSIVAGISRLPGMSSAPETTKAKRVLFVDDHQVMRQGLIKLIIGQPDIQVVGEAANGRDALEQVQVLRPDVVIMDVSMPVMDGVEATRRIKADYPEVRVIALSMFEDEQITREMTDAGAEDFISKTVSSAQLLKAIYGTGD